MSIHLRTALLLSCLAVVPLTAYAEDDAHDELMRARNLEMTSQNHAEALNRYKTLLARDGLPEAVLYDASMGAGRCLKALGRAEAAATLWRSIVEDTRWSPAQKARAEEELTLYEQQRQKVEDREDAARQENERKRRDRDRVEASRLLDEAEKMLDAEEIEAARDRLRMAAELAPWSPRMDSLLQRILDRHPDHGKLIHELVEFFESADLEALHELLQQAEELYEFGKSEYKHGNHPKAHLALLKGIDLIDESGFLSSAELVRVDDLAALRANLAAFAELNLDEATKRGVTLERPIPLPPDGGEGRTLMTRLRLMLADAFGGRADGEKPLTYYNFAPPAGLDPKRSLTTSPFVGGLSAALETSTLSRVRWAERYIRSNIAARWSKDRVFERIGHMLWIQHRRNVHRRIAALRDGFGPKLGRSVVDVHFFAANAVGLVQACEMLGAKATHQSSGQDVVIPTRLVDECRRDLLGMEGDAVRLIGSASIKLDENPAVRLSLTDLTERHPSLATLSQPELTATAEAHSRYGVWIDLYAEPMPRFPTGSDQFAFSAALKVREPVGSTLVPKRNGAEPFTRIPRMLEQAISADHALPTVGTLALVGLRNPFPASNEAGDQLLVLLGVRGSEAPDPPSSTSPKIVPADIRQVVLPVGPLATEVLDYVAPEAWPRRHTASAPVSLETARAARYGHLQDVIARGAGLIESSEPSGNAPFIVSGGDVVGSLEPEELTRIEAFLKGLRSHENDVYEIDVVSAVATRERFAEWVELSGAKPSDQDSDLYVLDVGTAAQIDRLVREAAADPSLFTVARTVNARATQRVGVRKLSVESIVRDQHVRPGESKPQPYTAVPGVVEQGLIIEVRPRLARTPGYRAVSVRVRAARIQDVERVPFPHPGAEGAGVDLARWYPLSEFSGAPTVSDAESLLVRMPMPGATDRLIVVKIATRKVR